MMTLCEPAYLRRNIMRQRLVLAIVSLFTIIYAAPTLAGATSTSHQASEKEDWSAASVVVVVGIGAVCLAVILHSYRTNKE